MPLARSSRWRRGRRSSDSTTLSLASVRLRWTHLGDEARGRGPAGADGTWWNQRGRRGVSPLQGYGAEYLDLATLARLKVVPPHEIGRQWVCTEEGLVFESHVPLVVKPTRRNPKKSKKQTEIRKAISSLRSSETTPRALTEARPRHTNHRELSARAYRRGILQPKALQQTVSADRAADRATDRQQFRQC